MSKKSITVSHFLVFFFQKKKIEEETVTLPVILYGHETGPLTLKEEQIQGV
jgi:hypothetical protein